jgi:hypothetical protein
MPRKYLHITLMFFENNISLDAMREERKKVLSCKVSTSSRIGSVDCVSRTCAIKTLFSSLRLHLHRVTFKISPMGCQLIFHISLKVPVVRRRASRDEFISAVLSLLEHGIARTCSTVSRPNCSSVCTPWSCSMPCCRHKEFSLANSCTGIAISLVSYQAEKRMPEGMGYLRREDSGHGNRNGGTETVKWWAPSRRSTSTNCCLSLDTWQEREDRRACEIRTKMQTTKQEGKKLRTGGKCKPRGYNEDGKGHDALRNSHHYVG